MIAVTVKWQENGIHKQFFGYLVESIRVGYDIILQHGETAGVEIDLGKTLRCETIQGNSFVETSVGVFQLTPHLDRPQLPHLKNNFLNVLNKINDLKQTVEDYKRSQTTKLRILKE